MTKTEILAVQRIATRKRKERKKAALKEVITTVLFVAIWSALPLMFLFY